jgi:hypothetical protein
LHNTMLQPPLTSRTHLWLIMHPLPLTSTTKHALIQRNKNLAC